ncbi:hypothetical protein GCM10007940_01050 [Portibacter lacus]|uniref:Tetratricopeptide repeat protein n=1 Tax=Portibacter lacus TaxID=1099794 RepID=A0AA37SK15_9BACT|nr:hypothetical protein GCM10007940_01050 [Portibacter lacus]
MLVNGQLTATYTQADRYFSEGMDLFNHANYGLAMKKFAEARKISITQFDERSQFLKTESSFMEAKSALRGNFPGSEKMIMDFYYGNRPDPLAFEAVKEIADLKFEKKLYKEAIEYYNYIGINKLSKEDRAEVLFNLGYSHFINKDFETAQRNFNPILGEDTDYYYPTYYYMAMIHFFNEEYDKAIEYFFVLENFPDYKTRIPYYIAQIYFAEKKYDDIAEYVPAQLNNPDVQNVKELRYILGQTYFILNKYQAALPHLEYYESQSRKMRKEDFYQLAFTQYQLGYFEKAAKNFKELSNLDSKLGQVSNHYLADSYLKIGQKEEARVSFKNVMDYNLNLDMEQEATFNFGKLSAELGYDRAAISSLISLPPSARDYTQAQAVLGSLFESSKDYTMVIQTIESMESKSPEILKAYQKVILERGIQLITDGQKTLAKKTLLKAASTPVDQYYSAIIYFHIADISHQEGKFDSSIDYLNKYFTLINMTSPLPESASPLLANYIQAYNHLKLKSYSSALDRFNQSKTIMKVENYKTSNDIRKRRMYADILNRMGDCYFTVNQYRKASEQYQEASKIDFPGQDYAFFQLSMIQGLQGNFYEKIVLLDDLNKVVPNSSFRDDAFFQIGETQLMLGNARAAELAYLEIFNFNGRSPLITRALLKLGLIAYNKGDTNKAIEYYTNIFKNNPNKSEAQEALVALEEIYIQDLGKADEFVSIVEKSTGYKMTSLERDSLTYIAAQGRFENGEYIEAIDSYTKYIDQFPNGINRLRAIYNRAESNTILNNYAKALPDYDRVINAGQSDYYEDAIYKAAVIAYNDLQKFEESFNYYNLLQDVTSDKLLQYEAQVGALRSANRFGDLNAVLAMSSKVINNPLAGKEDKALANFFSGKMNYANKSWAGAKANLQQVVLLVDNENAAEAKYLLNDILFKEGKIDEAEEITLETVSNSTAYPYWVAKNLILLSDIMIKKDDLFNAKAAIEAVIENFPESEELTTEAKKKLEIIIRKEKEANRIEDTTETIKLDTIGANE